MQADYHFWQDLFETYRSLSEAIKLAWLVSPVSIVLFFLWLKNLRSKETIPPGELVYTVRRDEEGRLLVYSHCGGEETVHELLLEEC